MRTRISLLLASGLALCVGLVAGCASDGYSSSSSVTVGTSFYYGHAWYGNPGYWYDDPDYIVVPPDHVNRPDRPGEGVRPERPSQLPAQQPTPSTSNRSRMPAAQPRMSSPSSRASIPRSRGGGGFRR